MTGRNEQDRGRRVPPDVGTDDFSDDLQGRNSLQGEDQSRVRNQRHAVPGVKRQAEDVLESFEKSEAHEQARRDAGVARDQDGEQRAGGDK
jgi:hypothetical protein